MRTRTSPRNQQILWKALGKQDAPPAPAPVHRVSRYWDCRHYAAPGRDRSTCKLSGLKVAGITTDKPCFRARRGPAKEGRP